MGTNYYWHEKPCCSECGRDFESKHIGKSSAGWVFSLHIHPEDGIDSLADWQEFFAKQGSVISNEYGEHVSVETMLSTIMERSRPAKWDEKPFMYDSWEDFHDRNHSQRGPNGLIRHRIGRDCQGHGEGTWDYITGDFS